MRRRIVGSIIGSIPLAFGVLSTNPGEMAENAGKYGAWLQGIVAMMPWLFSDEGRWALVAVGILVIVVANLPSRFYPQFGRRVQMEPEPQQDQPHPLPGVNVSGDITLTDSPNYGRIGHEVNIGPPRRVISSDVRTGMLQELGAAQPARIGFASTQGDFEAHEFKLQLIDVFREAGWQAEDRQTFMFFGAHRGIVLTIPFGASEEGLPQVVARALARTGNEIKGNRGDMANDCGLYVQVWHAPEQGRASGVV